MIHVRGILVAVCLLVLAGGITAHAVDFNSTNFNITGSVGDSIAGGQSSTNYKLTSSSGQSINGTGSGGSYKLGEGYTPRLEQSLQLSAQPSGLGLYYPFDENNGTKTYDSSINSAVGTFSGTPTWTTSGRIGNAITFDASTDYVATPASSQTQPTSAFTVEAWVKPSNLAATGTQKIVSNTNSGGMALYLTGTSANLCAASKLCFVFQSGGVYQELEANKSLLTDGSWTHLAVTYDGTTARMYANGSEVDSLLHTGAAQHNGTTPTCVGAEASPTACNANEPFFGTIDEVKIFSRALTAKEVTNDYFAVLTYGAQASLTFPTLTPGTSQTVNFDTSVLAELPGYNLAIDQNQNLTNFNADASISAISASIGSPAAWNEGTTKGLGFTMYGTNATAIPGAWNSGANYAAIPNTATTFYTRTGSSGGSKDIINMRLRLDTVASQKIDDYENEMTVTGTMTP